MAEKKMRIKKIIILTALSFGISLVLYIPDMLSIFENKIYDVFSRLLNPLHASERIVIVEVDQKSIDALSRAGNNWPWPRQIYAPVIEYLSEADAVIIDILYTEPSIYGQEDDLLFAEAIKKAGNVHLPFYLSRDSKGLLPQDMAFISRFAVKDKEQAKLRYQSITAPIDVLREHIKGSGNVAISPDSGDVYRRIPLLFTVRDIAVPNLTFSYFTVSGIAKVTKGRVIIDNTDVPLSDGRVMLRYFSSKEPFQRFSAVDILNASIEKGFPGQVSKEYFRGKVVFIGLTAPGLFDLKPTPVSGSSTGVHIHATLFDNLINKTFMRPVIAKMVVLLMLVTALFVVSFVLAHHSLLKNLSFFISAFFFIIGIAAVLFTKRYYLPSIYPTLTLLISFIVSMAFNLASEGKERLFIRRTFSKYMDKTIVDYVLQNPDIIKPGGQRKWITVLFADIAGFTTISEKHSPQDAAKMLHTVFNELTEVVIDEQGVVDKYIGDCIMAFWGAPLQGITDEINACRAAIRFIESIESVNRTLEREGIPSVALRVGLHSGDAIVGNMGSARLFDYTVIGDTVNLASRLESVNKVFKTRIIVSEKTLEKTNGLFFTRDLGPIEVKGKSEPVHIYELLCDRDSFDRELKHKIDLFHEGLSFYRKKCFKDAKVHFDTLLSQYPGDGPSIFYKERCERLMTNFSLTKDWDVIKMTGK